MSGFKLDTSGYVQCPAPDQKPNESTGCWFWSSLSPFAQGYIKRAFEDVEWPDPAEGFGPSGAPRFDWLAPATLAAMLEDCERFADLYGEWPLHDHGCGFWIGRQKDKHSPEFAPVHLYLADDGKIHQREAR